MAAGPGKGEIRLQCAEVALPEFPELKFGTDEATGNMFFDASLYLHLKESKLKANQFFAQYQVPILALCESYGKKRDEIAKINEQGHVLIDSNFAYLFISFVEPQFLGYVFERIHELFTDGVCVSDTYLVQAAQNRLSTQVLRKIIENDKDD